MCTILFCLFLLYLLAQVKHDEYEEAKLQTFKGEVYDHEKMDGIPIITCVNTHYNSFSNKMDIYMTCCHVFYP